MVGNYHGKNVQLKTVKELCAVTRMGVSVKDILDGGRKLGFECSGLKLNTAQLREIPLPTILFWKQDHFVVLYKISERKNKLDYYLADPGYGKIVVDSELLEKEWVGNNLKGVALVFQENEEAPQMQFVSQKAPFLKSGQLFNDLKKFIRTNKIGYFFSFLLLITGLAANWAIPITFKKLIDEGIIGKSINLVVVLLLAQLFLFIGNFCSGFFSDLILTKFNFNLSILLKDNFLRKLIRLPVNYFDTRLNTDTLQRLSDLSKVQSFLTWKGMSFLINVLNLVAFSAILFFLNPTIFFVFFVLSLLSIAWVGYFLNKRATLEYSMFIRQSENSNNLYEFIMNMPEIKVNKAEDTLINKITSLQQKLNDIELRSLYLNMYQLSGANFILKLKELITIAISAYLIINSRMTVGTLLSISYIMGQLSGPIINLINNIRDGQDADISNSRVEDVYSVKDEAQIEDLVTEGIEVSDLFLKQVSFKYPGSFNSFVLRDLSFSIPKNKITAIVGTSGSGKTTLLKLLLLYYSPNHGQVLLGRADMARLHPDDWRGKCGVVLQDGHIFSGTLLFNIALCENELVNYVDLEKAVKIACLEELVDGLPMGYNTKVGSVGMQLSGGQMQRILIARAVYKNPDFIFFDEATSSLDANTEKAIMNNLNQFFKGRTVVVVAHRLSTVKNADQIIVLENGGIIEAGSHSELVVKKDKYYSLVRNQLELGN
jgi:ATP-binding cassette subfamily B protein